MMDKLLLLLPPVVQMQDVSAIVPGETCHIVTADELMQRPRNRGSNDGDDVVLNNGIRIAAARTKDKPYGEGDLSMSPSSSSSSRRGSSLLGPTTAADTWNLMDSNIRVDSKVQKQIANFPKTHQGHASSAYPMPLNAIMKTWNYIPKLHQYRPAELQVVYTRRTGEEEAVHPSPRKKRGQAQEESSVSVVAQDPQLSDYLNSVGNSHAAVIQQNSSFDVDVPLSPATTSVGSSVLQNQMFPNTSLYTETTAANCSPLKAVDAQSMHSLTTFSQKESGEEFVPNLEQINISNSPLSEGTATNSNGTLKPETFLPLQLSNRGNKSLTALTNYSDQYLPQQNKEIEIMCSTSASQTEYFNVTSQMTTISSTQTDSTVTNEVGTATHNEEFKCRTNEAAVHVDLRRPSTHGECQTDLDIFDTPTVCQTCEFKQLQLEELEENMSELRLLLKGKVETPSHISDDEENEEIIATSNSFQDAEVNTDISLQLEVSQLLCTKQQLEDENRSLHETVQNLKGQLMGYQSGLSRLRNAIEKPIPEEYKVSEEVIQAVLHKADDFITYHSNSERRASKINDHLTVLNSCVTVANGILKDEEH